MGKKSKQKTNAARLLDKENIKYEQLSYGNEEDFLSGVEVASLMGVSANLVYKTLVTKSQGGSIYVAVIPSDRELDLKKLAKAAKEKRIEMINQNDILKITGYIKGGCSPIGMKKQYPTFIDSQAEDQNEIYCSAGKRGVQIKLNPKDLTNVTRGNFFDLTKV